MTASMEIDKTCIVEILYDLHVYLTLNTHPLFIQQGKRTQASTLLS